MNFNKKLTFRRTKKKMGNWRETEKKTVHPPPLFVISFCRSNAVQWKFFFHTIQQGLHMFGGLRTQTNLSHSDIRHFQMDNTPIRPLSKGWFFLTQTLMQNARSRPEFFWISLGKSNSTQGQFLETQIQAIDYLYLEGEVSAKITGR